MYAFLIVVHVIVCVVLILVVLLQAGRGGGFSEMLGGGQPQSLFGTQTNQFMVRATEVCAVVFIVTSLSLGLITSHRGKSLVEKQRVMQDIVSKVPTIPQPPAPPPQAPVTQEAPADTAPAPVADATPVAAEPANAS
jgi:preprotein translocase subunit SecG